MTTKTTPTDPLAALTPREREALASLARERVAAVDALRAQQERDARMDEYYRERAEQDGRAAEERAAALEDAEKEAAALLARPLRPGDDALALVRDGVRVITALGAGREHSAALGRHTRRLAVVAHAAGASDLAASEALGVRDARSWQNVKWNEASVVDDPAFTAFLDAARKAA